MTEVKGARDEAELSQRMLFTVPEVARIWHVSESLVYKLMREGSIEPVRFPGTRLTRIRRATVLEFAGCQAA